MAAGPHDAHLIGYAERKSMIGKKQAPSTLIGIAIEDRRAHFAQVRRVGDSFEVQKTFTTELSNSLTGENAITLGHEIRQVLQQQNLKEQRCVVALPVQRVLSLPTKIPELSEPDIPDFLNLEAER